MTLVATILVKMKSLFGPSPMSWLSPSSSSSCSSSWKRAGFTTTTVIVLVTLSICSIVLVKSQCSQERLVAYNVIMKTHWDRDLFPKHYPEFRPPAQWSKLVGTWKAIKKREIYNVYCLCMCMCVYVLAHSS